MKSKPRVRNSKAVPSDKLEMLYRGILDNALDCIITMGGDGRVLEFNPVAERVFGFNRFEAIGKELAELIIPPRMREQHRRGLAHYLKTGEGPVIGKRIEIAGVRKDGSEILVELAITALKIDSAPIFTAYLRDITERTRNEEASRHLAAIVESSDDAIVSKDLNGIITSWNRGAEKLFGFSADQVINKPITVIIPPDRYHEEQQILDRIHAGERVDHFDTVRRRKDGTLVNVSITVSPIRHADGRVIGASKIARDISERVRSARRRLAQYTVASLLAGSWNLEEASWAILQTIASIGDWVLSAVWIYDESIGRLRCEGFWPAVSLFPFSPVARSMVPLNCSANMWLSRIPICSNSSPRLAVRSGFLLSVDGLSRNWNGQKRMRKRLASPRIVFSLPLVTNCARRSIRFCSGRTEY